MKAKEEDAKLWQGHFLTSMEHTQSQFPSQILWIAWQVKLTEESDYNKRVSVQPKTVRLNSPRHIYTSAPINYFRYILDCSKKGYKVVLTIWSLLTQQITSLVWNDLYFLSNRRRYTDVCWALGTREFATRESGSFAGKTLLSQTKSKRISRQLRFLYCKTRVMSYSICKPPYSRIPIV